MTTFTYIAQKPDNTEERGSISSLTADTAREELRKRGLIPEDIREVPTSTQQKPKPAPLPWSAASNKGSATITQDTQPYAPLHETLRIFAGWLLAWYGVIFALGFLESTKKFPSIPFVHELFLSPLVRQFTFGTFLFLALSNIHHWTGKKVLTGLILSLAYVALVTGFVLYG